VDDNIKTKDEIGVSVIRGGALADEQKIEGVFVAECYDKDGKLKWRDTIKNVVTTVGKNYMLDGVLQTAVTIVGPYMGLISSVSYTTGPAAGDTMASHGGWTEAGLANAPTYTAPRKTCAWSAASAGAKALSAALSFAITGAGTIKGAFIVTGPSASATIDTTTGILYSAGVFTGGDRLVANLDTVNVSYTTTLT
jgi:hypothetical protein